MGLIAGLRVKGPGKRLLLLVPALALMVLSETIVPFLVQATLHSPGAYLGGFLCGVLLMLVGFVR